MDIPLNELGKSRCIILFLRKFRFVGLQFGDPGFYFTILSTVLISHGRISVIRNAMKSMILIELIQNNIQFISSLLTVIKFFQSLPSVTGCSFLGKIQEKFDVCFFIRSNESCMSPDVFQKNCLDLLQSNVVGGAFLATVSAMLIAAEVSFQYNF